MGFSLQLLISVVGFWLIIRQIALLNQGIQGDAHSRLYDHYLKVNDLLSRKAYLRRYFYHEVRLKEGQPGYENVLAEIEMMSEAILGLLEHAAVQKNNLPADSWQHCWSPYMVERLKKSPELQKFFQDNYHWYAKSFCKVVRQEFPGLLPPEPEAESR